MQKEGLVSTACACTRFSIYFVVEFGFCRFCRMLAHAHAVDTRPSLRIIEGLGTRLLAMETLKSAMRQTGRLTKQKRLVRSP